MRKHSCVWNWCIGILLMTGCGTEMPVQPVNESPANAQSQPASSQEAATSPAVDAVQIEAEQPQSSTSDNDASAGTEPSPTDSTAAPDQVVSADDASMTARTYHIAPGDNVQFELQARLIEAVSGDVIQLEAGRYILNRQLDAVADNLTIRGQGGDQTVLTLKGQTAGGQGIEATGNNFTLENLAVEDTAGNAVKILGAKNVTLRGVRVEWTGEPGSSNGAYGLYPVQCENVLIENCTSIGASDAGIYVGQCRNVVVRSCHAERNVAGIEIENTVDADVYNNVATNNTGGILVFDMEGLQLKAGSNVRVFQNKVMANNHRNFADPGGCRCGGSSGNRCDDHGDGSCAGVRQRSGIESDSQRSDRQLLCHRQKAQRPDV